MVIMHRLKSQARKQYESETNLVGVCLGVGRFDTDGQPVVVPREGVWNGPHDDQTFLANQPRYAAVCVLRLVSSLVCRHSLTSISTSIVKVQLL